MLVAANKYDVLLEALSTSVLLSWSQFEDYVASIFGAETVPQFVRRDLSRLGHIDCFPTDNLEISVTPASIVQLPECRKIGVFCGRRLRREIQVIDAVSAQLGIQFEVVENGRAPTILRLHAESEDHLKQFALSAGLAWAGMAANLMSEALPSAYIPPGAAVPVTQLENEGPVWLNLDSMRFEKSRSGVISLCSVRRYFTERSYFVRGNFAWEVDRYRGTHLVSVLNGRPLTRYVEQKREVEVKGQAPLPDLFERCLVLCSGSPPSFKDGNLYYQNVPQEIYEAISHKISATVEDC